MELGAADLVGYAPAFSAPVPPNPGSSLRPAAPPHCPFLPRGTSPRALCVLPGLVYGAGGSIGLDQGHLPLPQLLLPPGAGPPLHSQSTIGAQTPPLDQLRCPGSSSPEAPPTIPLTQVIATDHSGPKPKDDPGASASPAGSMFRVCPYSTPAPTFTSTSLV